MSESRYFENPFLDFEGGEVNVNVEKLTNNYEKLFEQIEKSIEDGSFPLDDTSVYTGLCGVALFYYYHYKKAECLQSLQRADDLVKECLTRRGKKFTFLCGEAGPLSLSAVTANKLGQSAREDESLKKLKKLGRAALEDENDELLFGRSGFLYALLFARHELKSSSLFGDEIEAVCSKILESGRQLGGGGGPPLMWQWHGKKYLGAAHGVAGIIHTLLLAYPISQSVRASFDTEIRETLTWLISQRYATSGNWFSSVGSSSGDKLVQWCHGSAAVVHAFLKFHEISLNQVFLRAALEACDVIWQRGLLRKGFGICHGASGNAYSFLAAYKATQDKRHLHRALKFADFCCEREKWPLPRQPDRPFSLFEGCAGTAWFLLDLRYNSAVFPAFELIP